MLTSTQQTAFQPSYFPLADSAPALGSVAGNAPWSCALLIGLFVVLALASALQAVVDPELLGEIFARL